MTKPSSLTLTRLTLQNCGEFGFYFACSTCHQLVYVMLELGTDGIVLSKPKFPFCHPNWCHSKFFADRTSDVNLLISCAVCRSGETVVTVSKRPDGTYFLAENLDRRKKRGSYYDRRVNFARRMRIEDWRL